MERVKTVFLQSISRCKELNFWANTVTSSVTAAIDISDIYRAQIVLAFSALDYLVHETVRIGMIECYDSRRTRTRGYDEMRIPLGLLFSASGIREIDKLSEIIQQHHSWQSFQAPDKITEAISKIVDPNLFWNDISSELSMAPDQVRDTLKLMSKRRNQIAHEADINPVYGITWSISSEDASDVVDFIKKFGIALIKVVEIRN